VLDADNRLALTFGMSSGSFQIPQQSGPATDIGSNVNGQTTFPSENLEENQREITSSRSWAAAFDGRWTRTRPDQPLLQP